MTDTLPTGVTFVSATASQGSCTGATTVVCTLGEFAAAATVTVTIVVQPTVSGTITNRANATAATQDPNPVNNATAADTTVLPVPPPPPPPPPSDQCHPSYPDVCIKPPPPDLDCGDIPYRRFRVIYTVPDPDPHGFDGDRDGVGCES
jgi:hypothetical protein